MANETEVDVAQFTIKINGDDMPRTIELIGVHITKAINKISMAKIVIKDGDVSTNDFVLSKSDLLIPGNEIQISAGGVDGQSLVFSGIIVKQSVSIRGNKNPQLIIDCRHKAVKATIVRRSNCLHNVTDDAAITSALKASGLSDSEMEIETTTVTHPEMVQYDCTDWDFAVSCAETAGKVVLTNDDKIVIKAPDVTATASHSVLFGATSGATIIELDAEMDSRTQYKSVVAKAWDKANQQLAEATASEPSLPNFGNMDGSTLADVNAQAECILQHGGGISSEEIQQWADAGLLKSRLSKIRGRVKFDGTTNVNAGDIIELQGLGDRFNGNAFVSGIRHDYTIKEGWKTQAQFGQSPDWFVQEPDVVSPKAGAMLPGTNGLLTGIVTDNEDPEGEFRVRVKIPIINADDDGVWARMALSDAGNNRGMFFRPEINDEVLLGFLFDDPRQPVIIGMLHSSALASPLQPSNDNQQKGYTSREKLVLLFDDDKKSVVIKTPGGNSVTLSDDAKGISLEDQNGNKITMDDKGIVIQATQKIELKAGTQLAIGAPNLAMSADTACEIKGAATKLESAGVLTLTGAMVKIN
ncbi:MAG: type VI secretion system tip protein VgrG [Mucilaginibacter sp.]|nr:type VI secretion system tip protein VgrG [Mucilaginibacter sp.]